MTFPSSHATTRDEPALSSSRATWELFEEAADPTLPGPAIIKPTKKDPEKIAIRMKLHTMLTSPSNERNLTAFFLSRNGGATALKSMQVADLSWPARKFTVWPNFCS